MIRVDCTIICHTQHTKQDFLKSALSSKKIKLYHVNTVYPM